MNQVKIKIKSQKTKVRATIGNSGVQNAKSEKVSQIFLRFEKLVDSKFLPIPKTEVNCIDNDPIKNDILGTTNTDADGNAKFELIHSEDGESDLDIFFLLKCGGKNYEKLGLIEYDLSTKNLLDIHDRLGYYENYDGSDLGTKEEPLTFRNSLLIYLKFEIWDNANKAFVPLADHCHVDVLDEDGLLNPDDALDSTYTKDGKATVKIAERNKSGEVNPDIFFIVKPVTTLNTENTIKPEEGIRPKKDWSSERWISTDRRTKGYITDLKVPQLGTKDKPVVFRIVDQDINEIDEFIEYSYKKIVKWDDLQKIEFHKDVTRQEWYNIGRIQKELYLIKLLKRNGRQPADKKFLDWISAYSEEFSNGYEGVEPFEFTENNNIFMLEAVAEYFLNYNDPRITNLNDQSIQQNWKLVDLRMPIAEGMKAQIKEPDLIGLYDLPAGIKNAKKGDILYLDEAIDDEPNNKSNIASNRKYFLIKSDITAGVVRVYGKPHFPPGTESSPWRIIRAPSLVLIDSFGARNNSLKGESKPFSADSPRVLEVNDSVNLTKINNRFDTINIKSTQGDKRYEIVEVSNSAGSKSITVDRDIQLGDGTISSWHVPSGVSGQLPNLNYNLGPGGSSGNDHYDGMMFVIFNGAINGYYRWSSYTSRTRINLTPRLQDSNGRWYTPQGAEVGAWSSSIRGNRYYEFESWRTNWYRNFGFLIREPGKSFQYGVQNARFYFDSPVADDSTTGNPDDNYTKNPNGKTGIIIHHGNDINENGGSGSAGCLVSPLNAEMRSRILNIYIDHKLYSGVYIRNTNLSLNSVGGVHLNSKLKTLAEKNTQSSSISLYNNRTFNASYWDHLVKGVIYLIRPDEKALNN